MVDFVAVIEKAVSGLNDNTPEMREKVYEKARGAIRRQLENLNPPVTDAVREKQLAKLEEAIQEIEDRNTEAFSDFDEDAFADILTDAQIDADDIGDEEDIIPREPTRSRPARSARPTIEDEFDDEDDEDDYDDVSLDDSVRPEARRLGDSNSADYLQPRRSGGFGTIIAVAAAIVVILVVAIGLWTFRGTLSAMVFGSGSDVETADSQPASSDGQQAASGNEANSGEGQPAGTSGPDKFTQRLMPDGSEVDEGPGTSPDLEVDAEGRSVAALDLSQPDAASTDGQPAAGTDTAEQPDGAATAAPPQVGQKMFLYEERLGQQAPTAEEGSVVWSIVRESPGDNLPPEPAIEAQINVPGKGLSAILTIKRNADQSLPASHLIEIVFAVTEEFDGNGIGSIQNFALKQTEQDTGDSLIAVPAKITDSFFMIALNDYVEAVQLNLRLLRERNWIDLPVSYGNGRRALLTLEKGSTGAEVFDQVIRAWEARTAGGTQ
ncbi:hypothetical protein [Hoeflea prorocentri]|uniref:Uncharacterized protein n=1 Tax=Hoeflea prorocentri TaxID=1922333 RepID=A0A9X3UEG2_9HYPH|nr:hypothetical protein [Hoeflea prorocentri]MCY6379329.1 hypothetical protein [Hoeflea prorocentri]MDA5397130.1 hypothetical protein [Hoeflea prorocentri]